MSPKVTYWTGTWDPAKEAISKELDALRSGSRARSPVVSFSPGQSARVLARDRVVMLPGRAWPVLRGVAALLEPWGDVTHVFGGRGVSWHLLRALGRRPVLLTAVVVNPGAPGGLPATRIARVAVENEAGIAEWTASGIPRSDIEVVRPGIDIDWYAPASVPERPRFTLLFASTPPEAADIGPRGIPLLVELARRRPDIDIVMPWRLWGEVEASRRVLDALHLPANVTVTFGNVTDMRPQYSSCHATIVCFEPGSGKTTPNFVLEGLASARPCITTADSGLAADLERSGAGVVVPRDVAALASAVDTIKAGWPRFSECARLLAVERFGVNAFRASYERIYREIALIAPA